MHSNKKALSEIVSYAILIVITISLSIGVYAFLKVYIPKQTTECQADINLIVQDYSCSFAKKELNITLLNKGLFKADAAYVRLGNVGQKVKPQINKNDFLLFGPGNTPGLNPGDSSFSSYIISSGIIPSAGTYELEVQPVVIQNKQLVPCSKGIITQSVECK